VIVFALHVGAGLPKPAVARLIVEAGGVRGDVNRYRHNGRRGDPDMAVSLYSVELAAAVATEGWPVVTPGALGENLSTQGVDMSPWAAGQRWRIGEVVVELSRKMQPCRTLTALVGPARLLPFQKCLRDRRGWYARVVTPGVIAAGDRIAPLGLLSVAPAP
jgi:MOSC domain-containing protein YiiM